MVKRKEERTPEYTTEQDDPNAILPDEDPAQDPVPASSSLSKFAVGRALATPPEEAPEDPRFVVPPPPPDKQPSTADTAGQQTQPVYQMLNAGLAGQQFGTAGAAQAGQAQADAAFAKRNAPPPPTPLG